MSYTYGVPFPDRPYKITYAHNAIWGAHYWFYEFWGISIHSLVNSTYKWVMLLGRDDYRGISKAEGLAVQDHWLYIVSEYGVMFKWRVDSNATVNDSSEVSAPTGHSMANDLKIHHNKIYTLHATDDSHEIKVFDLDFNPVRSFPIHANCDHNSDSMLVQGGLIYIATWLDGAYVYSINGDFMEMVDFGLDGWIKTIG